ncbi:hypothetical protein DD238_002999 [Peronospora effusa]|uniref:Pentacotripeptide-repeat region of PRORP domain-containing protein n=1 Tax=Peronospora effusa TaxID=542832 RepID=A0A3M6VK18_9STRA|nr:hypothetical protein DD238_002999 [Peronospora effusa]RQM15193.1 hypothetical protein DD237_002695 [Peronospora effusa]
MLLRTWMRSALALRRSPSSSQAFHSCTALPRSSVSAVSLTSKSTALQPDNSHVLTLLEHSIAQRRPTQALTHLAQLQLPPEPQLLQKLAVLLARQKKSRGYALRAFEILRGVYRTPGLKPDDYTKLASIYVMDACLRFRLLDSAMELYDEAVNQAVVLDLPAYNGLLTALLEAKRLEEATEILRDVVHGEDVCPHEEMFLPVLMELIKSREYSNATDIMKKGISRGVEFTSETFHPLLLQAENDTVSTDSLVNFLTFVEDSWTDYKDYDVDEDDMDDSENPYP